MTTIILNKELRSKLPDFEHEAIFCDEEGRTIGRFLPEAEYMRILYERAARLFKDEELDRAAQEPGSCTTEELLARLERI